MHTLSAVCFDSNDNQSNTISNYYLNFRFISYIMKYCEHYNKRMNNCIEVTNERILSSHYVEKKHKIDLED